MRLRFGPALSLLAATLTFSSLAQTTTAARPSTQTAVALHPDLLPGSFAGWRATTLPGGTSGSQGVSGAAPATSSVPQPRFLADVNRDALEECGPLTSVAVSYTHDGASSPSLQVTAIDFKDASGATAAFAVLDQPDLHELKHLGARAAAGEGAVLLMTGTEVAVAYPATAADSPALQAMVESMPKPVGSRALKPLLPTILPGRGLAEGSTRYALGERSYMASGGVLPAAGLGWDKDAEAVTAKYNDRRGAETLTLLLYPTPTIAGPQLRAIQAQLPGLGPSFVHAFARREGALIVIASGSFTADAAQALAENTHMHQIASTDKAMPTPEVVETRQTFGTLANTIILSGILCAAALFIGIFLGGGRALIRILQGKPAATEAEFLSLHLDPQNPLPRFASAEPADPA